MKPLTTDTLPAYLAAPNILILDLGAVSLQLVKSAVEKHATNVTTKGGLWLPIEIWDMVFQFGAAAPPSSNLQLVKATNHPQAMATAHIIRFKAVRLTQISPDENFSRQVSIWRSLDFIACREAEGPEIKKSNYFTMEWDAGRELTIYAVTIPREQDGRVRFQYLYKDIKLYDVIATTQDGQCRRCSNARFICSCQGMRQSDPNCCSPDSDYGERRIEYCMAIPCPVCLGLDLFVIWEDTLVRRFKKKRRESAAYLSRILGERLEDLHYPASLGKSSKQIMAEHERALEGYARWKKTRRQD